MALDAQERFSGDSDDEPSSVTPPERDSKRPAIVMRGWTALGFAWAVTVVLAFAAGWFGGRLDPPDGTRTVHGSNAPVGSPIAPVDSGSGAALLSEEIPSEQATAVAPQPAKASKPVSAPPRRSARPIEQTSPTPATPSDEALPEAPPAEPVVQTIGPITEGFGRAVALADAGDFDGARAEAETLLDEHGDYSGLVAAFRASGSAEVRGHLEALRVLQLGGLESVSMELARELKRSYAGTAEVQESIHAWRILKPRVAALDAAIQEGVAIVVGGVIENPDIGAVRRVVVEVEALDAAGNVLATTTAKVRPKSLDAGAEGSFSARFTNLDSGSVIRTRATVVKWKSEVR